jgi:tetratricopeptide (TPR) repeat protein
VSASRTARVARVIAVALVLGAAGCGTVGGKTFVRAYAAADRDYSAGRFLDAADSYESAAKVAERDRDRDEALYAAADAHWRAGDDAGALERFDKLADASPPNERSIRCRYRAAEIRLARGEADAAYAGFTRVFTESPEHGVARKALYAVVGHVEATKGKSSAIAYELELYPKFEHNRLGEELCFDVNRRREDIGQAQEALRGYLGCADRYPYPSGALFDDALIRASILHEKLGDAKAAVADCERILAVRETSYASGSYNRPLMATAQLRIAELQRDALGDKAAARASFHKVYANHKDSILRPKALYQEAKLAQEAGDASAACDLGKTLLDEFSWTRWARTSDELCPALKERAQKLRDERTNRKRAR